MICLVFGITKGLLPQLTDGIAIGRRLLQNTKVVITFIFPAHQMMNVNLCTQWLQILLLVRLQIQLAFTSDFQ